MHFAMEWVIIRSSCSPTVIGAIHSSQVLLMSRCTFSLAWLLTMSLVVSAGAELTRWNIVNREPYAGGQPRGDAGAYEQWTGTIHFALNPQHAANQSIVDLSLAPKNAAGRVEFSADFRMLVPTDPAKAN